MKIPKHIIMDYSKNPNEFLCERCGARRPAYADRVACADFVKQGEAFAASHRYCESKEDHHGKAD
jgi:hypothetical protein